MITNIDTPMRRWMLRNRQEAENSPTIFAVVIAFTLDHCYTMSKQAILSLCICTCTCTSTSFLTDQEKKRSHGWFPWLEVAGSGEIEEGQRGCTLDRLLYYCYFKLGCLYSPWTYHHSRSLRMYRDIS